MRQHIGITNMAGLMENDASVEICKSADFHEPLGKVFAKALRLSHISHKPY
jgi:hypothetical protein